MKIACFLIKHFWELQEIENTIIACFCPSSYCLRMRNWRSLFFAILRKVRLEDMQFSVLSTITFMSNWRNPVMKKHHPQTSIKTGKVNLTRTSYATKLLLLKHHKMACLRCLKENGYFCGKYLTGPTLKKNPYTCKLCNKNLCCWNIIKMACFRCFNRKWLIVWQIFDRTHTEEKPIHVQAMKQKLVAETS